MAQETVSFLNAIKHYLEDDHYHQMVTYVNTSTAKERLLLEISTRPLTNKLLLQIELIHRVHCKHKYDYTNWRLTEELFYAVTLGDPLQDISLRNELQRAVKEGKEILQHKGTIAFIRFLNIDLETSISYRHIGLHLLNLGIRRRHLLQPEYLKELIPPDTVTNGMIIDLVHFMTVLRKAVVSPANRPILKFLGVKVANFSDESYLNEWIGAIVRKHQTLCKKPTPRDKFEEALNFFLNSPMEFKKMVELQKPIESCYGTNSHSQPPHKVPVSVNCWPVSLECVSSDMSLALPSIAVESQPVRESNLGSVQSEHTVFLSEPAIANTADNCCKPDPIKSEDQSNSEAFSQCTCKKDPSSKQEHKPSLEHSAYDKLVHVKQEPLSDLEDQPLPKKEKLCERPSMQRPMSQFEDEPSSKRRFILNKGMKQEPASGRDKSLEHFSVKEESVRNPVSLKHEIMTEDLGSIVSSQEPITACFEKHEVLQPLSSEMIGSSLMLQPGPTSQALQSSSQVLGPKSQVLGYTSQVLQPTSQEIMVPSHVFEPTSQVLGPTLQRSLLGPTSQVLRPTSQLLAHSPQVLEPITPKMAPSPTTQLRGPTLRFQEPGLSSQVIGSKSQVPVQAPGPAQPQVQVLMVPVPVPAQNSYQLVQVPIPMLGQDSSQTQRHPTSFQGGMGHVLPSSKVPEPGSVQLQGPILRVHNPIPQVLGPTQVTGQVVRVLRPNAQMPSDTPQTLKPAPLVQPSLQAPSTVPQVLILRTAPPQMWNPTTPQVLNPTRPGLPRVRLPRLYAPQVQKRAPRVQNPVQRVLKPAPPVPNPSKQVLKSNTRVLKATPPLNLVTKVLPSSQQVMNPAPQMLNSTNTQVFSPATQVPKATIQNPAEVLETTSQEQHTTVHNTQVFNPATQMPKATIQSPTEVLETTSQERNHEQVQGHSRQVPKPTPPLLQPITSQMVTEAVHVSPSPSLEKSNRSLTPLSETLQTQADETQTFLNSLDRTHFEILDQTLTEHSSDARSNIKTKTKPNVDSLLSYDDKSSSKHTGLGTGLESEQKNIPSHKVAAAKPCLFGFDERRLVQSREERLQKRKQRLESLHTVEHEEKEHLKKSATVGSTSFLYSTASFVDSIKHHLEDDNFRQLEDYWSSCNTAVDTEVPQLPCTNRLMLQMALLYHKHHISHSKIVELLVRIAHGHPSDFGVYRVEMEKIIKKCMTLHDSGSSDLENFLNVSFEEALSCRYVGQHLLKLGIRRQHLLRPELLKELSPPEEPTNGMIVDLWTFLTKHARSMLGAVCIPILEFLRVEVKHFSKAQLKKRMEKICQKHQKLSRSKDCSERLNAFLERKADFPVYRQTAEGARYLAARQEVSRLKARLRYREEQLADAKEMNDTYTQCVKEVVEKFPLTVAELNSVTSSVHALEEKVAPRKRRLEHLQGTLETKKAKLEKSRETIKSIKTLKVHKRLKKGENELDTAKLEEHRRCVQEHVQIKGQITRVEKRLSCA